MSSESFQKSVIIVAGGSGKRMNSRVPKQFLLLNGKPLLFHTIHAFHNAIPGIEIVLVLPKDQIAYWKMLAEEYNFYGKVKIAEGGSERFHSVQNGLKKIKGEGIVAIHDGVRPFVSRKLILDIFETARKKGNAVPAVAVKETLRFIEKSSSKTVDRNRFALIQTPQGFQTQSLRKAYRQKFSADFTDDAGVVENTGVKINLISGDYRNIKITTPEDFELAEAMLGNFEALQ